jgi:D-alanine--poly(phosphoribitol) ligase subunit 1
MFSKYIAGQFLDTTLKYSQNNAFCINEEYFSYIIFIQRIAAIAISLQDIAETDIALVANDDLDTYAAIFAIWLSGKMYVPLNPDTPVERNRNIIDQVGIKTILNSSETAVLPSPDFEASVNWLETCVKNSDFDTQLAYIFFTSGSTGTPKGVLITKKNVAAFMEAFRAMGYDINENDRCLQMFDLTFDLSVMSYLIPLLKGACVYTIPKDKIKYSYIFELMDEKELTVALMVPSILNYLRPYFSEIYCPKMKYSLFCGEALHTQIVEEWAGCVPNARIDNVYGPTEDTIFCTYYTFKRNVENDSHNGVLSIGKPMLNNLAVVFNDGNSPANLDETGELCLAGSQLTPGYFNNPRLNAEQFFTINYKGADTRFYRTGDLCIQRQNGNIDYVGRKDSQVKIQGFRIELSEIEFHAKKAINGQTALVALAVTNKAGNNEIAIVLESNKVDVNDLKNYMTSKLPSYMVPTQYHFIKPFPLNTNGKIDRRALRGEIKI